MLRRQTRPLAKATALITLGLTFCLLTACASFSSAPPASPLPTQYVPAPGADETTTLQSDDNLTLFGQWWLPPNPAEPKAVILMVHGTFIHSGFYDPWATYASSQGYAVFGVDLRGWGQSQGFGRRGYVLNMREYVSDVAVAYDKVRARYPHTPIFIQGESLGGVVAMQTQMGVIARDIPAEGLILNAPATHIGPRLGPFREPYWMVRYSMWLLSFTGDTFPNFPLLYYGRHAEIAVNFSLYDKDLVRHYKADPFVTHTALTARYFLEVHRGGRYIQQHYDDVKVPLFISHGSKDNLIPPSSSEEIVAKVANRDATLKIYPGMMHATLHDTGKEEVWRDIVAWMETHRAKSTNR